VLSLVLLEANPLQDITSTRKISQRAIVEKNNVRPHVGRGGKGRQQKVIDSHSGNCSPGSRWIALGSLQDGNYGFWLAFAFFLPISMFPWSPAFMLPCSLAFMFACMFALLVFALPVVFELLVVVQPDQKTDAESKNRNVIVRRIEVPPMSLRRFKRLQISNDICVGRSTELMKMRTVSPPFLFVTYEARANTRDMAREGMSNRRI
jgi:hypothetical protein